MANLPTVDALESCHSFPCRYMFKVIGHSSDRFVGMVVASVREEIQQDDDPPFRFRQTSSGLHMSVTIEPEVTSPQQVLAIYSRLSQIDGLIMLL